MTYVAIDLETSGRPETDKYGNRDFSQVAILSIGAWCSHASRALPPIARVGEEVVYGPSAPLANSLDIVVRPEPGFALDPQAMKTNGLTEEQLAAGMPIGEALEALTLFLIDSCADDALGHNISQFDIPLLRVWYERVNRCIPSQLYSVTDTRALWLAWTHGLRRQKWEREEELQARALALQTKAHSSLDHIAQTLLGASAKRTGAHNATADAILAARVYEAMRERGIIAHVLNED